jgi:acetylornithine deacetylase
VLTDDLIAFHKNLTQIESITYNEEEVGNWLSHSLESQGYTVEKQLVDREAGRFNIYAYPGSVRDTKVLVSSHIDTVSWISLHVRLNRANHRGRFHRSIHTRTKTKQSTAVEV